jgi:protocatechuate 3,4-dioxygenase beta subunit
MDSRRGFWPVGAAALAALLVFFLSRDQEITDPPKPRPDLFSEDPANPLVAAADPVDCGSKVPSPPAPIETTTPRREDYSPPHPVEQSGVRTLRGKIIREDGEPLVKPRVAFIRLASSRWRRIAGRVASDGTFEIPDIPEDLIRDPVEIDAGAEGFLTDTFRTSKEDLESRGIWIALQKPVRYSGRFVDEKGNPVAGTRVRAQYTQFESLRATSDAKGRFSFLAPARRSLSILVTHRSGARDQFQLPRETTEDTDLGDIPVAPAGTIKGRVLDRDGTPVVGATVQLRLVSLLRSGRAFGSARTGSDGRFRFDGLGAGYFCVCVDAQGGRGARAVGLTGGSRVDLVLVPLLAVRIRIVDARTGEPITPSRAVIRLRVKRSDSPRGHEFVQFFWTKPKREVTVYVTEPGYYDLRLESSTLSCDWLRSVSVRPDSETLVDLPTLRARGR